MPSDVIGLPRHLGQAVRKRRLQLGLSQASLAEAAQVSRRLITSLEMGDADGIAFDKALRILEALGMTISIAWPSEPEEGQRPAAQTAHAPLVEDDRKPSYQDAYDDITRAALRQAAYAQEGR